MLYDDTLDDNEWRAANFPEDVLASAWLNQRFAQPSVAALIESARKYGQDGILEAAIMLGQDKYRRVEDALAKLAPVPVVRRRRKVA